MLLKLIDKTVAIHHTRHPASQLDDQHVARVEKHQPHRVVPEAKAFPAGDPVQVRRELLDEELPAGEGQQVPLVRLKHAEER
jgi:hypothetical protein